MRPQRAKRDLGTPEAIARRVVLAGPRGDPSMTGYPLGVLLTRRLIDQDHHNAGMRYAWLYAAYTGRYGALGLQIVGFTEALDEAALARATGQYRLCKTRLERRSPAVARMVDDVAVHGVFPPWVTRHVLRDSDLVCHARLVSGLDLLAEMLVGRRDA